MEPNENQMRAAAGYEFRPQIAVFTDGALRDPKASEREGHNVYNAAPYVTSRAAGERDSICIPATKEHRLQFPAEWAQFQERQKGLRTALEAIPTMTAAVARTLRELGIKNVEALSEAPILERVELAKERIDDDPFSDSDVSGEAPELPKAIPAYLAKWQTLAKHYLTLKHFATTGEKPRVKLEAA